MYELLMTGKRSWFAPERVKKLKLMKKYPNNQQVFFPQNMSCNISIEKRGVLIAFKKSSRPIKSSRAIILFMRP